MAGKSVIHFKFQTAPDYKTVTLDGETISVFDIKRAIVGDRGLSRGLDWDLEVANAQTKQVYADETALVPKNTSVLVKRVHNKGPVGLLDRLRANTPLSTAHMYDEYASYRRLCGGTPYVVCACSVGSGLVGCRACTVLVGIRKLAPLSGAAGKSGVALWRWNELRAGEGKTLVAWHDLRVSLSMEKNVTGSVSGRGSPLALSRRRRSGRGLTTHSYLFLVVLSFTSGCLDLHYYRTFSRGEHRVRGMGTGSHFDSVTSSVGRGTYASSRIVCPLVHVMRALATAASPLSSSRIRVTRSTPYRHGSILNSHGLRFGGRRPHADGRRALLYRCL